MALGGTLLRLAQLLAGLLALVELGGERLGGLRAQGLLDELAGLAALGPREAPGLDGRLAPGADGDLDDLVQDAPPTRIDSRMDPSGRACSTTEWPFVRASILARSTAYACRNRSRCSGRPQWPL